MADQIRWLRDVDNGKWVRYAEALRAELPVPNGFVVTAQTAEPFIRSAYDDLKIREHTHFTALRGSASPALDVIGTDALVHTLRRLWNDTPNAEILVQAMVNSAWCGKAAVDGKTLRIRAAEGLLCLDSDAYVFNLASGKCTRRTLHNNPRKVFRAVDGSTRTMEIAERRPLEPKYMEAVAELAKRMKAPFSWALDHRRVWLIDV